MKTSTLIVLLLGIALPCFQSAPAPQAFDKDTEAKLIAALRAAKGLKINHQEVKGMETMIEDEEVGKDPEAESDTVKDEIALAFKRIMMMDPGAEIRLKDEVRSIIGPEKAEAVFEQAEKIMWEELQQQAKLDKELNLKKSEKKAFGKLVNDVEHGKDPLHERKKIEQRMREDAAKIMALSPEEQEEEKDMFYAEYGQETGDKVFQALRIIHEAAVKKGAAVKAAKEELHEANAATS
ncbi:uncharacterized protein LOC144911450 [Branchiostoma floridae x Branchiostoma belcheri]